MDETYVKVAGRWRYVYRAVDQHGQVIDVLLSAKRDLAAAQRFLSRALHTGTIPAEVTTDPYSRLSTGHRRADPRGIRALRGLAIAAAPKVRRSLSRHEQAPGALLVDELLTQDVCVPAVLSEFAKHMKVHPAQREWAAPVAVDRVIQPQGGRHTA